MIFSLITSLEPVAINKAYRRRGFAPGMYMVDEGKSYKEGLFWEAKQCWKNDPFTCDLEVVLTFIRPNRRSDIDAYIKLTLDALQKVVYENDRQIRKLTVEIKKGTPQIEITVKPLTENNDYKS